MGKLKEEPLNSNFLIALSQFQRYENAFFISSVFFFAFIDAKEIIDYLLVF